jgi:hypothetical protein
MIPFGAAKRRRLVRLRIDRAAAVARPGSTSALAAFAVLVILGYTVPWGWTGFRGNTVWDWLKLVVLPLTVVLVPRIAEMRRHWSTRHTARALIAAGLFVALVAGGYLGHWQGSRDITGSSDPVMCYA